MGKRRAKFEFKARKRVEKKFQRDKKGSPQINGTLSVSAAGYGFVTPEGEEPGPDLFIPPKYLGDAMDGDKVAVKILESDFQTPGRGPAGRIVEILSHGRESFVGELLAGHVVRPLSKKIPGDVKISGGTRGAKKGDWVEVKLFRGENKRGAGLLGAVADSFGHAGEVEADLQAVIREFDLPPPYTEAENEAAARIEPLDISREDHTKLFCATIDPFDAKDHDDAISISPGPRKGQLTLGVHIAEVAAWIHPGSKWDRAARERSFTAYLPGKTMPMLPKSLTALISLLPDRKSPAHSVFFTMDSESGRVISSRRCHSWVTITKRLNFDEVQAFIDGGRPEGWDDELCEKIGSLVKLTRAMRECRRREELFLELATPEIRVICDDATKTITGISRKFQREADQLVEDCMLAANTAVASEMIEKKIPGVFRVHEEPEPLRFEELSAFIEGTFGISTGDLSSGRAACNHFLSSLPNDHRKPVIMAAFLRALPRAHYLEEPALHYGLGKERYSHFTSPIRRYPDLLVHQQLWNADSNGKLHSKITLGKYAESCSKKEENNDDAYYAANDRLKLHYLRLITDEDNPKLYEGIITKVSSAGLLADITDLGIFGFVPIEMLSTGRLLYSKEKGKLHAERGHQQYKCGDFIYLRLDRIDMARGSAIFRPVH